MKGKNSQMSENIKTCLPTSSDWDRLVDVTHGNDFIMHWRDVLSWCRDSETNSAFCRTIRGYSSARYGEEFGKHRDSLVGFRPAVRLPSPGTSPDGALITIGTLYMNGKPIRVPTNPTWSGNIISYVPNVKLELRAPIQNAAYQVKAIKVGNLLIADRVMLKNISWDDLYTHGFC